MDCVCYHKMVPIETVVGEMLRDLLAYHFDEAIPETSAGQQVIDRIVSALKNEKVVAFGRLSVSDFFVPVPSAFWSANWLIDLGIHGEGVKASQWCRLRFCAQCPFRMTNLPSVLQT